MILSTPQIIHLLLSNPIFQELIVNNNINTWKNNLKKHSQCPLQTSHINEIDKNKLELIRNNI